MSVWQPTSVTFPTLNEFEMEYNGLKFGANTAYGILEADGLGLEGMRSGDTGWPRDHGEALGLDVLKGRDLIIDLWVKSDGTSLQHAQVELAKAFAPSPSKELALYFKLPNLPVLSCMCRVRHRTFKIESDYAAGKILKVQLDLHAVDPRFYAQAQSSTWSSGTSTVSVNNEGNMETRAVVALKGPLKGSFHKLVVVENATLTPKVAVNLGTETSGTEPLVVSGTETWTIDFGVPHRIVNGSGVSKLASAFIGRESGREGTDVSAWWSLVPGSNTIQLRSVTETGWSASIEWASAYLL